MTPDPKSAADTPTLRPGATAVAVPMDEQPEHIARGVLYVKETRKHMSRHFRTIKPPYRPGDSIPLREEWRPFKRLEGTGYFPGTETGWIEYRADKGNLSACKLVYPMGDCPNGWSKLWWGRNMPDDNWQPADTMPDWAVRRHARVLSCVPRRYCDLTEEEARKLFNWRDDCRITALAELFDEHADHWHDWFGFVEVEVPHA